MLEVGHLDSVGTDAFGSREPVCVIEPIFVCGGSPRSGAGDIPAVKIFQGYGDELIEDQRSARSAIFCVG